MSKLPQLRKRIDALDEQLLNLIKERRMVAHEVIEEKKRIGAGVRDVGREQELLLARIKQGTSYGLPPHFTLSLFHLLIEDSLRIQHDTLLASTDDSEDSPITGYFQEEAHEALARVLRTRFDPTTAKRYESFISLRQALKKEEIKVAALFFESTVQGLSLDLFSLFEELPLYIIGEALIEKEDAQQDGLSRYIKERYVLVSHTPKSVPLEVPCTASLLIQATNEAGSLANILDIFKTHRISLHRIESKPLASHSSQSVFYVEAPLHQKNPVFEQLKKSFAEAGVAWRAIGCYPSYNISKTQVKW